MSELIEESPTPLYLQLENILLEKIESNEFSYGSALPSEQELMSTYNVSRTTVRQALSRLAEYGVIVKVQGKGTYVNKPAITQELVSLRTISEVLTSAGLVPEVHVLGVEMQPEISTHVLQQLRLEPHDSIVRVKRQHFVEGEPIAYAVIYLSGKFQWRFSAEDLKHQSIYSWLEEQSNILVDTGFQVIKAKAASEEVAAALHLQPGDPVLHVENTSTTDQGVPIEHTEFYFPPERYILTVQLRRTQRGVSLENVWSGLGNQPSIVQKDDSEVDGE